ncbi:GntR family transcriptional regulator [Nocardioides marinquilinus]|uniref:GntR family transcriptional regulator n=1 Tax=Nocardioides marinquilinus TaxID=1210400 RepID=UPI0031EB2557
MQSSRMRADLAPTLRLPDDAGSLADGVARAVRDGIASGALDPAHTYSVYRLADDLDVSRSPVREAMLRLAEAGLVEIERNRGFRVVLPRARDVEEIFEVRLALEPPAAGRAARAGCPDAVTCLRTMDDAARAGDEPAFWDADRALHRALLLAAGNGRAAAIVEQLRSTTALLGPPTTATGRSLREIHAEHAPIVTAVGDADPVAAEAAMRAHLEHTGALLVRRLRPAED